jgi:hypothetical protein
MKDRPDIIGVVDGQFFKHLLVAEVKENSPTLEDIYQIKRYKEVFEARDAFLITIGPIKEELKRLFWTNVCGFSGLMYAGRIRNGFAPASRRTIFSNFQSLSISKCPFRNLPESGEGRRGEGLTAKDMEKCRWLKSRQ